MISIQVERKICFPKNGKLKIMQVSDIQDMHFVRPATFKMLEKAYDTLKPDLVIFTGDNVHGNHLHEYRIDLFKTSKKEKVASNVKKAISYFAKQVNSRKIPFSMIYGNHDDMNCLTKQEQADFYKEYEYFFGLNSDENNLECDTFNIPIYNSNGENVIYNIWMLDSAGKDDGNGNSFCYVNKETVEWYRKKSDELKNNNNGKTVPSLMFQHIPVMEVTDLFIECDKDDKEKVKWGKNDGKYYKLDKSKATGFAFEYPAVCEKDFGQLEALKEKKDVCAIVFGHDHANSFTAEIDGIKIIQTSGASFRSYGTVESRGIRIFEIDEKDTSDFETYQLNYYDILGKNPITKFDYFMSADEYDDIRTKLFLTAGATLLTITGIKIIKKIKK